MGESRESVEAWEWGLESSPLELNSKFEDVKSANGGSCFSLLYVHIKKQTRLPQTVYLGHNLDFSAILILLPKKLHKDVIHSTVLSDYWPELMKLIGVLLPWSSAALSCLLILTLFFIVFTLKQLDLS